MQIEVYRMNAEADSLTYFLEYYLVALSAAVNEMKAKREQQQQDTIEAEQKLAAAPLVPSQEKPAGDTEAKSKGNPVIMGKNKNNKEKVDAALDELQRQGYEQFTLHDMEAITGMNRKYISKLLLL